METLEPVCSVWMLLTAVRRIVDLQRRAHLNVWALVVVFHYSFGKRPGHRISLCSTIHFRFPYRSQQQLITKPSGLV